MAPAASDSMMMVEEKDKYGGTLRVVSQASIKSLDPDFCTSYVCWAPSAGHLLEPLMTQAADFSTQPMLLDSWDVSDDGNTWTLNLREGVKFHDGTPLTSEAAILSTKRVLNDTPAGEVLKSFLAEDGLQIVDDLTFSVQTTEPYGSLLDGFALRTHGNVLVYTPTAAAFPMTEDVGEENIIGTGPYMLENWDVGVKVTLARNEDYQSRSEPGSWMAGGKKAYLDKIEWLEIPSEETKVAGLKTGEWDFIDSIGLDFVAALKEDPDVGFTWYPGHMWYFGFNVSEEPMDNLLLRKAIQASMSGEDMLSAIGPPDTWKLNCSIYGSGTVFESDAGCELYNQNNIARAKELLAESGYAGEPIVILNPTDYSTITPVGPVIKARMEEVGINVDMPGMDWATATSKRLSGEGWHIFTSWGTIQNRQNPALSFLLAGGGKSIGFGYYNEELHGLHDKFLRATDFETQKMIADDMQRSFLNDPPQVYSGIFFMPSAYRTWVHDVPPEHPGTPYYANVWMSR
jgi:peptide/nickel transport system substrate-binding protein